MEMSGPHTYTAQYLNKWHAGFNVGNQSFVLQAFEGTEEEAKWYAEMMEKAFAKLRVVEDVEYDRSYCKHCGNCDDYGNQCEGWNYCPKCGNRIKR
jgi:hypothetical protein